MTITMNTEQARFNMIEQQIRPWDVLDADFLKMLGTMKRENFVRPEYSNLAFTDMALPLPGGEFMLPPKLEARLVHDLKVQAHEHVLEIGTGSGYMAALLSKLAAHVTTMEINPELVEFARENLADAEIQNVNVLLGDGAKDTAALGKFDVILLSGSVASVPPSLLAHLKPGGRLAAIVGQEPVMRAQFVTLNADNTFTTVEPWDTIAPRLHNFPEPSSFSF